GPYTVSRSGSMSMTTGPAGDLMITDAFTAMRRGGEWYAVDFTDRAEWSLSDRYRLGASEPSQRLGRPARTYVVFEGDLPRVRITVDDATAVPLLTEVLDGDGRVYRVAALMEVTAALDHSDDMPDEVRRRTVAPTGAGARFPASLAGYRLMDAYAVEGGGVQGYYSDGLFSFSVFQTGRGTPPAAFDGATRFAVAGSTYLRVVTPTVIWVYWAAPDHSYVLVGDLPPDHLATALADLPAPGERGLLVRMWRRLFG
ncbi:MAG TPA: hypothetical protein VFY15_06400, partial [Acidimicrobiia bacterium]|nr:hypothetical protein [Acidimicrobiia bacterium]